MNRKSKSAPVRFGLALRVLFVCFCLAAPALGYLQQKTKLSDLGHQHRDLEVKIEALVRDNKGRSRSLDSLKTPVRLEAVVREMNLGLGPPMPNQIVRLGGSAPTREPVPINRDENTQLASTR